MKAVLKNLIRSSVPPIRRLVDQRNDLAAQIAVLTEALQQLRSERNDLAAQIEGQRVAIGLQPSVLQYRRAYFEIYGKVAPDGALPRARAWPCPNNTVSYRDKLVGHVPVKTGRGAEIGPLNLPLLSKHDTNVLYVDHLDTAGIRAKYSYLTDIAEVDRPMVNNSLEDTLRGDAPLDYVVASQVMEHVPSPIRWMNEIAGVLRVGGLLSISLPDRRMTFDLYREETRASDMIAAYLQDLTMPDVRAVYDHHSQASAVNMHYAIPDSLYPHDVINGKGAVSAKIVSSDPMDLTKRAQSGEYLDVHCWVFTPPSFLLLMADIANAGLLQFRCKQFYPTNEAVDDRANHSFVVVLEKTNAPADQIRRSFLEALG